jgi:hypothetical protein
MEANNGKVRADVAHDELVAMGFTGSERTARRAVATVGKAWAAGIGGCIAHGCPSLVCGSYVEFQSSG